MSLSNNLINQKLGLGYLSSAFSSAGFDNKPHTNLRIRDYKFDVINLGTLRKPIPTAVLRKNIYADIVFSRRKQWAFENIIVKNDQKIYEVISELALNLYGDYAYFAPYKIRFETLNTSFFKPRLETRPTILKNIDKSLPYTRLQFPTELSNTLSLTGSRNVYNRMNITPNVLTTDYYISGYNSGINYANRNTFLYKKYNNFSGYIPYPHTVTTWQYPTFNLNTKIALDSVYTYPDMYKDMQGLLVGSLKYPNGSERIVYVSPHGIANKFYNTIIDSIDLRPSRIQPKVVGLPPKYEYVQVNSGITVNVLDIGSEYLSSGQNIFETGLVTNSSNSGLNYSIQNHLKQTIPLKDTWFYKFYSGLYINNKTLATGTWDGIIPSGHSIVFEYLATKDGRMGTNNEFRFIYQNYGDNSFIDQSIRNTFKNPMVIETGKALLNPRPGTIITDPLTERVFTVGQPITFDLVTTQAYDRALAAWRVSNNSNFIISTPILKRGFGTSYNLREAVTISNQKLKNNLNIAYGQLRKLLPSNISIHPLNSKLRKINKLFTTNNYDYVSVESIPSGAYGCFRLANRQVVCIDPPSLNI